MKWYIHIGPNKTATTTIQNALSHARKKLKAVGVVYPKSGSVSNAHHVFQWAISMELTGQAPMAEVFGVKNIPSLEMLVAEARQEAKHSNVENILISTETLWDWNTKRIKRFREVLGEDEAEIVMSLRPHFDRELSMWQEVVKHGFTKSPLDYLDRYSDTAIATNGQAYYERCTRWKEAGFNVAPIPFPKRSVNVSAWDYFLDKALSIKIGSIRVPSVLNDSLDYFAIIMMQAAFENAISMELLGAKLHEKNKRLIPTKSAIFIREKVVSFCDSFDRKRYPAYASLLLDPDIERKSYDRYGLFLQDVSSVCGLTDKRISVGEFVDHHNPNKLIADTKMIKDFSKDAATLNKMAKEKAIELIGRI